MWGAARTSCVGKGSSSSWADGKDSGGADGNGNCGSPAVSGGGGGGGGTTHAGAFPSVSGNSGAGAAATNPIFATSSGLNMSSRKMARSSSTDRSLTRAYASALNFELAMMA